MVIVMTPHGRDTDGGPSGGTAGGGEVGGDNGGLNGSAGGGGRERGGGGSGGDNGGGDGGERGGRQLTSTPPACQDEPNMELVGEAHRSGQKAQVEAPTPYEQ